MRSTKSPPDSPAPSPDPPDNPRSDPSVLRRRTIQLTSTIAEDLSPPTFAQRIPVVLPWRHTKSKWKSIHADIVQSLTHSSDAPDPPPDSGVLLRSNSNPILRAESEQKEPPDIDQSSILHAEAPLNAQQANSFEVNLKPGSIEDLHVEDSTIPTNSKDSFTMTSTRRFDRYNTHSDSLPYLSQTTIDRYGFPIHPPKDNTEHRKQIQKEKRRLWKWENMIFPKVGRPLLPSEATTGIDWDAVKSHRKIKPRIRKGIPQQLRGAMWQHLCGARDRRAGECAKYGSKRLYSDLAQEQESPYHEIMWKDINRTYRTNLMFGAIEVATEAASEYELSRVTRVSDFKDSDMTTGTSTCVFDTDTMSIHHDTNQSQNDREIEINHNESNNDRNHLESASALDDDIVSLSTPSRPSARRRSVGSSSIRSESKSPRKFYKHALQDPSEVLTPRDLENNATPAQYALYNVLKSFSLFHPEVGYCQGMQSITALLLMYMTEEEAFWVLVCLADDPKYQMAELWREGMPGIHLRFYQLQRVVELFLPKLAVHFEANDITSPSMYQATQWFITIFLATDMKFGIITRIWDIYLNEGWKIVFRMAIGYLKYFEKEMMSMEMHEILMLLRNGAAKLDPERYFSLCFSTRITRGELKQFEKEFYEQSRTLDDPL